MSEKIGFIIGDDIDLERWVKENSYWIAYDTTFDKQIEKLKGNKDTCFITWKGLKKFIKLYTSTSPDGKKLVLDLENCVSLKIFKNNDNGMLQMYIYTITTDCVINESIFADEEYNSLSNTWKLLTLIDKLAFVLGVKRIFLTDDSYVLNSHKIISLSLITVMNENKTFYEKYNYRNCNGETENYPVLPINLTIHKTLLRNFSYKIFKKLLNEDDLMFVLKIEKHIDSVKKLSDFFNKSIRYLQKEKEFSPNLPRYLKTLNDIFYRDTYPWYSMVSVIENEKKCFEKIAPFESPK